MTREYAEQMLKAILRPGHRIYVLPRRSRFGNSRFRLFAAEDNVIAELTKYVAAALNVPCSRGGIFVRCSGDEVIRSMVETLGFVLYGDATAFVMRTL